MVGIMEVKVSNQITIANPSDIVKEWIKNNLILDNPEYHKKVRMNLWVGNTPKKIYLYYTDGDEVIIPYGYKDRLLEETDIKYITEEFVPHKKIGYLFFAPLYDWQMEARNIMLKAGYGILQSRAGSGKTRIGLSMAMTYNTKTLWLTHTIDLLSQSYNAAKEFCEESLLGSIKGGKVQIGKAITFATVQTMSHLNLYLYKDMFDVIIVDECHRVAASAESVTQFQKVIESLSCRHKYGLSATVERADGLIETTFALLGGIKYKVPDEVIKTTQINILPRLTQSYYTIDKRAFLKSDGTLNFTSFVSYLASEPNRNQMIIDDLKINKGNHCLILSDRVTQLDYLRLNLDPNDVVMLTSSSSFKDRQYALNQMRLGIRHYLFATYQLAKEGLDIPNLDRLFYATPTKTHVTVVQSLGRVGRLSPNKDYSIVYDYVDNNSFAIKMWKDRVKIYREERCEIINVKENSL